MGTHDDPTLPLADVSTRAGSSPAAPAEPSEADSGAARDAERWRRVKAIFNELFERERTAREAALLELQASDPAAAAEARSLLRRYEHAATSFLAEGATLAPDTSEEVPDLSGRVIGGYRLVAPLGRGGMGAVYQAVREEDGKRVAVKLLRFRGEPEEVAAQVRAERRILAGLEHDNIARLIDGGATPDGMPYFTLELIEGRPIVDYCRERSLDVEARLQLFRAVCAAVTYAHRKLVIHCDIKPANILVTGEGVPKLLDFGIARLLRPGDETGGDGEVGPLPVALTPEYAAPEQVRRRPVSTATDVYALGLLLYELLTGRRAQALQSLALAEIVRVVCATMPPRPSQVVASQLGTKAARRLGGDLDAIVLKALKKEPGERYGSARELSEDVGRYLAGEPVQARDGGAVYRGGLFLRRHRAAIAAGLLVVTSLIGGTVAAMRQARRAERRFEDVRKLAGSFLFEFHEAIRDLPGATPARRLVVDKALEYLDSLAREAAGDPGLLAELATAYVRVGDVQGYPANANLGDTAGALASYRKALDLARQVAAASPEERDARFGLATALERLGTTLRAHGDGPQAKVPLEEAKGILLALAGELPRDGDVTHALHVIHLRLGQLLQDQGEVDGALRSFHESERIDRAFLTVVPGDKRIQRDLSVALSYIASLEGERDPKRGLELYAALLPPSLELAKSDPTNAQLQRDLLIAYEDVAQMQGRLGQFDASLDNHHKALEIAEALLRADPDNEQALQDLSVRHAQIGDVLLGMGRLEAAYVSYYRSLELDARLAARDPNNARATEFLGWSHLNVAGVLDKQGQHEEALHHFRQAIAVATPFSQRDPTNASLKSLLADAESGAGEQLLHGIAPGRPCPPEGRAALQRALDLWSGLELEAADEEHRAAVEKRLAACPSR